MLLLLWLLACSDKDMPEDRDGDGFLSDQDCDDEDPELYPAADERCDGVDNDCDGSVDEGAEDQLRFYLDADGDGYGELTYEVMACEAPDGYAPSGGDCDDGEQAVFPGALEVCDGVDNDCDGLADDADPELDASSTTTWYRDADGDGYGDQTDEGRSACLDPSTGFGAYAEQGGDCEDGAAEANPGEDEVCGDGLDNNCDGSDEGCERSGTLTGADLDGRLLGEAADDGAGAALAGLDADGDGVAELLVGAPGADAARDETGAVYRVIGPVRGTLGLSAADAIVLGEGSGDGFGAALAGGDLDGDGYDDLLAGAPEASDAGAVFALYGPFAGRLSASVAEGSVVGEPESRAGATLALVGDTDDDGLPDTLVGAPEDGVAWLCLAPWSGEARLSEVGIALSGEEGVATALAGPGDVSGDGIADLLVGAPEADDGAGAAWLVLGPVTAGLDLDAAALRFAGEAAGDGLGTALSGMGDHNRDGLADFVLGAPGSADPEAGAGQVWLVAGAEAPSTTLGDALARLQGAGGAGLGSAAALLGDLDADGRPDMGLGAAGADTVWVAYGRLDGVLPMAEAELLVVGTEGDGTGQVVAGPGDVDGDGRDELLVGAAAAGLGGSGAGAALLLYGAGW